MTATQKAAATKAATARFMARHGITQWKPVLIVARRAVHEAVSESDSTIPAACETLGLDYRRLNLALYPTGIRSRKERVCVGNPGDLPVVAAFIEANGTDFGAWLADRADDIEAAAGAMSDPHWVPGSRKSSLAWKAALGDADWRDVLDALKRHARIYKGKVPARDLCKVTGIKYNAFVRAFHSTGKGRDGKDPGHLNILAGLCDMEPSDLARWYRDGCPPPERLFADEWGAFLADVEKIKAMEKTERKPYADGIGAKEAAKRIHGTRCYCCGFDFGLFYGELGAGFIQVHHLSLSTERSGGKVNPATDMIPLCSNCHDMIHHGMNDPGAVNELRALVERQKLANERAGIDPRSEID